ncbi:MAG: nucleotidyl transferase AbiEii/AbiGii toxin family protein [Deltaproteobacteria bacterium]|nr:nucleotidyl transferase AbiEii/AbiGii toxin family protein [Deltaproteobacteria bacterium]
MLFERILKAFADESLRYAIIGGIAVNLHGYNRLTGDLDIVMPLDNGNISKFVKICRSLGLVPRLPVKLEDFALEERRNSWISEKNMKVFSVYNPSNPLEHVDVKIDRPDKINSYLDNSQSLLAGEIPIVVVSLEDLIALKKESGRERDLVDIRALERLKEL